MEGFNGRLMRRRRGDIRINRQVVTLNQQVKGIVVIVKIRTIGCRQRTPGLDGAVVRACLKTLSAVFTILGTDIGRCEGGIDLVVSSQLALDSLHSNNLIGCLQVTVEHVVLVGQLHGIRAEPSIDEGVVSRSILECLVLRI